MTAKHKSHDFTSAPAKKATQENIESRASNYDLIPLCKKCPNECKLRSALGLTYFYCRGIGEWRV